MENVFKFLSAANGLGFNFPIYTIYFPVSLKIFHTCQNIQMKGLAFIFCELHSLILLWKLRYSMDLMKMLCIYYWVSYYKENVARCSWSELTKNKCETSNFNILIWKFFRVGGKLLVSMGKLNPTRFAADKKMKTLFYFFRYQKCPICVTTYLWERVVLFFINYISRGMKSFRKCI